MVLTQKSDIELIDLVKVHANNEAFLEICRRYENIFYKVCQKYAGALCARGLNPQDIFEEKDFIIFHCVSTFQPDKNVKLGTWIGNYARYLCLNSINAQRFAFSVVDDEIKKLIEESQTSHHYFESVSNLHDDFAYIINLLEQMKDQRIVQIFKLRYLSQKRMIWSDIAIRLGVSTQTVINLHNKGLALLRKKIRSTNISDKI